MDKKQHISVGGPACPECVGVGGTSDGQHGETITSTKKKSLAVGGIQIAAKKKVLDPSLIWVPAVSYNKAPKINGLKLGAWAYYPGGGQALVYSPSGASNWQHVSATESIGPTGLMIGFKSELPVAVGGRPAKHIELQSIQFAIDKARAHLANTPWFQRRQRGFR